MHGSKGITFSTKKKRTVNHNSDVKKGIHCINCPLYKQPLITSELPVPYDPEKGTIWIVGEAPGKTEVKQTRPFVGKAGQLLRENLEHIGLSNLQIVITNACLCYPGDNKKPPIKAIKQCKRHFQILQSKYPPRLIIALGNVACRALDIKPKKISEMRGELFDTPYGKCLVTYHPSRILRSEYKLESLFILDLRKALKVFTEPEAVQTKEEDFSITTLTDERQIIDFIRNVPDEKIKSLDIETSVPVNDKWPEWGLDPHHPFNGIYSVAIAFDNKTVAFPVEPKGEHRSMLNGNPEAIKEELRKLFLRSDNWIAHNAKFEYSACIKHLGVAPKFRWDTEILAYLMRETMQGFYNLEALTKVYLPGWPRYKSIKSVDLLKYNAYDAMACLRLFEALQKELNNMPDRNFILKAQDFVLETIIPLLSHVELSGVLIDWSLLELYRRRALGVLERLKERIKELVKVENPRAEDFRNALVELCNREGIELPKTKTGLACCSKEVLKEVYSKAYSDTLRKLVLYKLTFTKVDKLVNTYLLAYQRFKNQYTNRIHPNYRPDGTATGRLSCEDPNFQQIPRDGLSVCKNCFVITEKNVCPLCGEENNSIELINIGRLITAPQNHAIVSVDYSQMEVRILAHIAQDQNLINAISSGLDLHSYTASKVFKIPYEEIKAKKEHDPEIKKFRQYAKSATFGIIYGITAQTLAQQIKAEVEDAKKLIERFFNTYPKVKEWIDSVHRFVIENKFYYSPLGRVRHFEFGKEPRANVLKEAQNFPIQSFSSDLTLAAANEIMKQVSPLGAKIVGLVHDSIKIEAPVCHLDKIKEIVTNVMTKWIKQKYNLSVPLEIDMEIHCPERVNTGEELVTPKEYETPENTELKKTERTTYIESSKTPKIGSKHPRKSYTVLNLFP